MSHVLFPFKKGAPIHTVGVCNFISVQPLVLFALPSSSATMNLQRKEALLQSQSVSIPQGTFYLCLYEDYYIEEFIYT